MSETLREVLILLNLLPYESYAEKMNRYRAEAKRARFVKFFRFAN